MFKVVYNRTFSIFDHWPSILSQFLTIDPPFCSATSLVQKFAVCLSSWTQYLIWSSFGFERKTLAFRADETQQWYSLRFSLKTTFLFFSVLRGCATGQSNKHTWFGLWNYQTWGERKIKWSSFGFEPKTADTKQKGTHGGYAYNVLVIHSTKLWRPQNGSYGMET